MAGQTLSKVGTNLPIFSPGGKQSRREGREVMETSRGRVIRETEQALVHPSTSKRSNVRPKCPVLSHDSTFANISNICFPLCSLTCRHPAPTNTSSLLFKHSLMRKYCYNEPQLKPGVKIKMNTGIAGKRERAQNRSCPEKRGQEQLQWLPGALQGKRTFRY